MKRLFDALPSFNPEKRTYTYAGIGSRRTPADVLTMMTVTANTLQTSGYTLNSGGAYGADTAFEAGASNAKNIFFAKDANDITRAIAKEIHPRPEALHGYVLDLMARNTLQIFGRDLQTPVDFVLCWTPDGCETHAERTINTGGTGQAISMASLKGIPVFNMKRHDWLDRMAKLVLERTT